MDLLRVTFSLRTSWWPSPVSAGFLLDRFFCWRRRSLYEALRAVYWEQEVFISFLFIVVFGVVVYSLQPVFLANFVQIIFCWS